MSGYIEGISRDQVTLFPDRLEDWIDEDHPVRVIDAFVDAIGPCRRGLLPHVTCADRTPLLPPFDVAEAFHLRLPEPRPVKPTA